MPNARLRLELARSRLERRWLVRHLQRLQLFVSLRAALQRMR
jgi:hypothetical protein